MLSVLQPQLHRVRQELMTRHFLYWSLRIVAPARFSKSELLGSWRGGRSGKESSEARRVAVMVRHFRCLQEKEARQIAQKAVQNGRRKRREEGRGPGAGLGSDRPGWPGWPGRASTPTSESGHRRGKFGSRKGRIRAGRWDRARGPCETDDVTGAEFMRLGGPAGQGGG